MTSVKQQVAWLSFSIVGLLSVSLIASLFFKAHWLWMDEVLSYLLISDPSMAHMNEAVVSGMDANPPLFANVYWVIAHTISSNPLFLRSVSILLFAVTIGLLYVYTTRLTGLPVMNFVLITGFVALTYLNLLLSTQIRAYSLFLLVSLGYFVAAHRLIATPTRVTWLVAFSLLGILLTFTHNFGLFYLTASGVFFALLLLWSKQRNYLLVLAAHGFVGLVWLAGWYTNFAIQTDAGKPHSWIPRPTLLSFFRTVGELIPSLSSALESRFWLLPVLRFTFVLALFVYLVRPRLRAGFQAALADKAFTFYLLAGTVYLLTIGIALVVTLVHTSVFISRYLWPSHLLLIYQLVYAWYALGEHWTFRFLPRSPLLLAIYGLLLAGFVFYQNRKVVIFPSSILSYLPQLDKRYPVFVETADYFLPIWFHHKDSNVHYLLDWNTAVREDNNLGATVTHKILKSVRDKYQVSSIVPVQNFTQTAVPHFYVVDESSQYQIEHFIRTGQVHVVRELPIAIKGHRLLECTR